MRKALIGMILAATVLSPVAAEAQRGRGGDRVREQNERSDTGRQERSEQRQQQREVQQTPQVQEAPQVQQQPQVQQPQTPVVQRERTGNNDRGGDRNRRGNNDGDAGNRDRGGDGNRGNRTGGGGQTSIYPEAWQGNPNDPALRRYQQTERRNQQRYDNDRRGDWRGDRNGRNDWNGNRDGRRDWNRNWRNDRRYDWQGWRHRNRNIFRAGAYYSPYRNWGYNRFNIGIFLEPLFYGQRYWLGDPWQYRLPPAYPGTQWVRYYNDVLLVDIYTGEVIDVIYGFFW